MILLIIAGIIAVLAGIIFLSGEKNVRRINQAITTFINKTIVGIDETLLKQRVGSGVSLILIGLFCFFMAYYVKAKMPQGVRIF